MRPDGGPVAELGQGVPAQPLCDGFRQPGAGRQPPVALQRREVAPPQPVGGDELADEALVVERLGVDPRIAPPRLHPRGEVRQGDAVVAFDDLRDRGADADARRPRREEPGAMRGVLHVVREGDHLAVVVVARTLRLTQRNAQQAGGAGAEDDQRLPRPAVRTVAAQPHRPRLAAASGIDRVGPEDADEAFGPTLVASRGVRGQHRAAGPADADVEAADSARRVRGEEVHHVDVPEEEAIVEDPQVAL